MTVSWSSSTYNEFSEESQRIEELIWAAVAIEPGADVVFCGFENSRPAIERALAIGAKVAVIETSSEAIRAATGLGCETIRASTTSVPIRADRFSVAVAYHYLHEIDPAYHTQVLAELGRIGRRIAVVEPGPPADLLGSRIASLYSRAKQRLGQFEQYQNLEYWRRLLLGVRSHVAPVEIRYAHLPPRAFLQDTMRVIIESMKIAGAAEDDIRALRGVAAASDVQLIPQPRYVLLAAVTAADIPDRPRMKELQGQAPVRKARRRKSDYPSIATSLQNPGTYSAKSVKGRIGRGLSWLTARDSPQPEYPTPVAHPSTGALRGGQTALPLALPISRPLAAPATAFGAVAGAQEFDNQQFGFGGDEGNVASMFSIPTIGATESMEWTDS